MTIRAKRRWGVVAEVLASRPHSVGAEIGVKEGQTSAVLLSRLPGLRTLYCVDPWHYYPGYDSDRAGRRIEWPSQRLLDRAYRRFSRRVAPFRDRVVVVRAFSREAAGTMADGALDFVFVDANHAYEYAREDIALWWPKVREGGTLLGHDYGRWSHAWGVKRAVDEAFGPASAGRVKVGPAWVWWVDKNGKIGTGNPDPGVPAPFPPAHNDDRREAVAVVGARSRDCGMPTGGAS